MSNKCYASIKYYSKNGIPSQQEISEFVNLYVKGDHLTTKAEKNKLVLKDLQNPDDDGNFPIRISGKLLESSM